MPSFSRVPGRRVLDDINDIRATIFETGFDVQQFEPLLQAALAEEIEDKSFWELVATVVSEYAPVPPIDTAHAQSVRRAEEFSNPEKYIDYLDTILANEVGPLSSVTIFEWILFQTVPGLFAAAKEVFKRCKSGNDPPSVVWTWLSHITGKFMEFSADLGTIEQIHKRTLAQPDKRLQSLTDKPKLNLGFVSDDCKLSRLSLCSLSNILVPGQVVSGRSKSYRLNPSWIDFERYAQQVMAVQDARRFMLGFTLEGSLMRVWVLDRLGGLVSEHFDINKQGETFVLVMLGFLCMTDEELGFDPTIQTIDGKRCIDIEREGQQERIFITELLARDSKFSGRGTTCWAGYLESNPKQRLVVKDSWDSLGRMGEGAVLKLLTKSNVVNVARYYHHYTVCVNGRGDEVLYLIRRGINARSDLDSSRILGTYDVPILNSHSSSHSLMEQPQNRFHKRLIVRDVGTPIYKAKSHASLLSAIKCCIQGHRSLLETGYLHRDISLKNLMIDAEDESRGFLIDLDMAVDADESGKSREPGCAGTKLFQAINILRRESRNTFAHDLESFFWVLFWICVQYDKGGERHGVLKFRHWYDLDHLSLAEEKEKIIKNGRAFKSTAEDKFTEYYKPMIPVMEELRMVLFVHAMIRNPMGLYDKMCQVLDNGLEASSRNVKRKRPD